MTSQYGTIRSHYILGLWWVGGGVKYQYTDRDAYIQLFKALTYQSCRLRETPNAPLNRVEGMTILLKFRKLNRKSEKKFTLIIILKEKIKNRFNY